MNTQLDLTQAKSILNKTFCFMQWQADDAKERGEDMMTAEDINYLKSINLKMTGIGMLCLDGTEDNAFHFDKYDHKDLFKIVEDAKRGGRTGLCIYEKDVTGEEQQKLEKLGCRVSFGGYSSISICEIYFSENDFIINQISEFQNLFGSLSSAVSVRLI